MILRMVHYLKKRQLKRRLRSVGTDVTFTADIEFGNPEWITVGSHVYIGPSAYFSGKISIGNYIMFGPRVSIFAGDHILDRMGEFYFHMKPQGDENQREVVIEDNVWIGGNTTILKGVTIGTGAVIGALSLVNRSIPPYVVAAGNPCTVLRKHFDDDQLSGHLRQLGYADATVRQILQRRNALLSH